MELPDWATKDMLGHDLKTRNSATEMKSVTTSDIFVFLTPCGYFHTAEFY